ncbi:inosine-uridine preferring nucleoside hydrolase [Secundilactobacillus pentosiphilus]|uniref:Inosine-uridine preferring nucleoside hydrolase n=1 Tax=Secundilactobacillus pentosiphilus TaxID=1714682 RepID=A0A1Z5ILG1_9LACO|nr:ribosylpyrimidine nucleosidase [Secundilactobacillus pentosiphilus]GAX02594.1 inosine-uridine preferring nucleoside hydrolase [Secundilactobacillus pentosiphilus]
MTARKIILDCDPGHDDAITMMMAYAHPDIDLLGITIVAGNQTLKKTVHNGLNVAQLLDMDVKLYPGMPQPLVREQVVAGNIHGKTGLDGPTFEALKRTAEKENGVQFIIDTLMASDGDITLVPTGPLTNIATAMRMEPLIIPKIKEIVLMGGAYGTGNFTPSAEFNIFADPEAAHVVFKSGAPIVMMGLDLTNQTICTPDVIERMEAIGNKAGKLFGDLMRFTLKTQFEEFGLEAGPIHDATTIGYLIDPTLFDMQDMFVEVDINRGPCYGRTVCDELNVLKQTPNAKVGKKINRDGFFDLVADCIKTYK